jgi:hypothetical protein
MPSPSTPDSDGTPNGTQKVSTSQARIRTLGFMTTNAHDPAFPDESAGATSSPHLTNRNPAATDSRDRSAQRRHAHLRPIPIERPRADDDAPAPVRLNRVVLALARLVREALEAEDQASDKGA